MEGRNPNPWPKLLIGIFLLVLFTSCRTPNRARENQGGELPPPKAQFFSIDGNSAIAANQCEKYEVVLRAALTEVVADKKYPIALSVTPEGQFFADSSCSQTTREISLESGNARASFFFRGERGGKVAFMVRSDGSELASGSLQVQVLAHATLTFVQPIVDFGSVAVGDQVVASATVRNTGLGEARSLNQGLPALASPFSFLGGAFPGSGGTCTSILSSNSECTVVLRFSPMEADNFSSSLRLSFLDDFEGGEALLTVLGEGASGDSEELLENNPDAISFRMEEFTESNFVRPLGDGRSLMAGKIFDGQSYTLTLALFDAYGERDMTFGNHGVFQIPLTKSRPIQGIVLLPENRVWLLP